MVVQLAEEMAPQWAGKWADQWDALKADQKVLL
jgi:hypothetical protein